MSAYHSRLILDGVNGKPSLVALRHALPPASTQGGGEVTSGLIADAVMLSTMTEQMLIEQTHARGRELAAAYGGSYSPDSKPYPMADGKAIIPIHGTLLNRFNYSIGFATGYSFIRNQLAAAENDDDVDGVIYDVNSYGGLVSGCGETATAIFNAEKPSLSVIDSACCSAAYYLTSATGKITAIPSATVGSIGVLMMHADYSKMLDKVGIDVTFIKAGDHKVDGNPYEPLSDAVKADWQTGVDKIYRQFTGAVATHRGIEQSAVVDTQARVYPSDEAQALGLIDEVQTSADAISLFNAEQDDDDDYFAKGRRAQVTTKTEANTNTHTQADVSTAASTARAEERARVSGIMGHAEAAGRTELANHLAMNTDMSVEAAAAVLKVSPKAAAPATETKEVTTTEKTGDTNHFKNAMDKTGGAGVGAGDENGAGAGQPSKANRILAAQSKAGGGIRQVAAAK